MSKESSSACVGCGCEIDPVKMRSFVARSNYTKKKTGKRPKGPFCSYGCRGAWQGEKSMKAWRDSRKRDQ